MRLLRLLSRPVINHWVAGTTSCRTNRLSYSVNRIFSTSTPTSNLIRALEESLVSISDPQQGLTDVSKLIELRTDLAKSAAYPNFEQDLFTKANVFFSLQNYESCDSLLALILSSTTVAPEPKANAYLLRASLLQHTQGNYKEALQAATQAELAVSKESSTTAIELKVIALHMKGELHATVFGNPILGKQYLNEAIDTISLAIDSNQDMPEQLKGKYVQRLANCYDALAEIAHTLDDDYDSCKTLMAKSLMLWQSNSFKQPFPYANSLLKQGKISSERGEYIQAIEKFTRASKLMQGYENSDQFIALCLEISKAKRNLTNGFEDALASLKSAQEHLNGLTDVAKAHYTRLVYEELLEVLLSQGDFEAASGVLQELKRITIAAGSEREALAKVNASELVILVCLADYARVIQVANEQLKEIETATPDSMRSQEIAEILTTKGIAQIHVNEYAAAIETIRQGCVHLESKELFIEVQEVWNQAVELFHTKNETAYQLQALGYLKRAVSLLVQKKGAVADLALEYIDQRMDELKHLSLQQKKQ